MLIFRQHRWFNLETMIQVFQFGIRFNKPEKLNERALWIPFFKIRIHKDYQSQLTMANKTTMYNRILQNIAFNLTRQCKQN